MDEPFSNLDRRTRILVREDTFAVLREAGTTAILVTHDQDDAMRMADRILMMQGGRIVQGGTAEELCRAPATLQVARFFAEWNEVPGVCRGGGVATPAGDFPAPRFAEGDGGDVCIRPSGIRFRRAAAAPGAIVSRHFLGETEMIHIAVARARPAAPRDRAARQRAGRRGGGVGSRWTPDDVLVFPAG